MDHQITCPACRVSISSNPIIEDAFHNAGSGTRSIDCECGENISYWDIRGQLKNQKKLTWKVQSMVRNLFRSSSESR